MRVQISTAVSVVSVNTLPGLSLGVIIAVVAVTPPRRRQACYLLSPLYIGQAISDLSAGTVEQQQQAYKSVIIFAALKWGYSFFQEVGGGWAN
jgi:hypothetical protein